MRDRCRGRPSAGEWRSVLSDGIDGRPPESQPRELVGNGLVTPITDLSRSGNIEVTLEMDLENSMTIFICAGCGKLVTPGTEATQTKGRHRRPVKMHRTCWDAKRSELKSPVHLAMTKHYKETNAACVRCGSTEEIEADHIVSRSEGGTSRVENYQPLCKRCNASKG